MCEKAFRKYRLNFAEQSKSPAMETAVAEFGLKSLEDLIANVGYGKITPLQVVRKFLPKPEAEEDSILTKALEKRERKKPKGGVIVRGVDDILVRFAKCCRPVRGDAITGYITRGFGVTVHRTNCINALKMTPERQIEVEWNPEIAETFPVKIRVRALDRVGLLADLAANISKNAANILSARTDNRNIDETVTSFFTITVENTTHLEQVLADIRKIKNVREVVRIGR
jgi:GTP pyrophosphokinase